ncbi:uncharacterized protein LOC115243752 [Formica exsecta]|uniref:uncharacterized protein LOC115243752 n=1 Tax=Formica exsecta TaxID=72781 RepID=UPI0011411CA0|nr:uncharacterized protein LOC115243752 [Formica exsecta]
MNNKEYVPNAMEKRQEMQESKHTGNSTNVVPAESNCVHVSDISAHQSARTIKVISSKRITDKYTNDCAAKKQKSTIIPEQCLHISQMETPLNGTSTTEDSPLEEIKVLHGKIKKLSRQTYFNIALSSSLRNWISSVNTKPGFQCDVFTELSNRPLKDRDCNLVLDGMAIRKRIMWDSRKHRYLGYCDYVNSVSLEDSDTEASEALVFMLVCLNGLKVWSVTCDGTSINFSMFQSLGCDLYVSYETIQCQFKHPSADYNVQQQTVLL